MALCVIPKYMADSWAEFFICGIWLDSINNNIALDNNFYRSIQHKLAFLVKFLITVITNEFVHAAQILD